MSVIENKQFRRRRRSRVSVSGTCIIVEKEHSPVGFCTVHKKYCRIAAESVKSQHSPPVDGGAWAIRDTGWTLAPPVQREPGPGARLHAGLLGGRPGPPRGVGVEAPGTVRAEDVASSVIPRAHHVPMRPGDSVSSHRLREAAPEERRRLLEGVGRWGRCRGSWSWWLGERHLHTRWLRHHDIVCHDPFLRSRRSAVLSVSRAPEPRRAPVSGSSAG